MSVAGTANATWVFLGTVIVPKAQSINMEVGGKPIPEAPCTPLKINMEPKNEGLEDDFPFQTGDFQVPC